MLDIHCHILPGVDDGAGDLGQSLAMARIAVAEGVTTIACTPHMTPGVYDNRGPDVIARVEALQLALDEAGLPLQLVAGADVHVAPDVTARLRSGEALALNGSRYVLIEPPHHVAPPRLDGVFFDIAAAGYQPILTHPERLTWIERRFDVIERLFRAGVWMQITAGSLEGQFGSQARYWAERMLDEGMVHVVASDAHDDRARTPRLGRAYDLLARRMGQAEADNLLIHRPHVALTNAPPSAAPAPPRAPAETAAAGGSFWRSVADLWRTP